MGFDRVKADAISWPSGERNNTAATVQNVHGSKGGATKGRARATGGATIFSICVVHFTEARAAPLDGHGGPSIDGSIVNPPIHSRDARAFGGDDGPVPHVVFRYIYDERENLRPGRVRDWDRDGLGLPMEKAALPVALDWPQKLDGRLVEGIVAESDRRVDDARVGGHRLGRRRRLIHTAVGEWRRRRDLPARNSSVGKPETLSPNKNRVSEIVDFWYVSDGTRAIFDV